MSKREQIIKKLEDYEPYAAHFSNLTVESGLLLDVMQFLREQPEVVRCKYCRNWIPGGIEDNDTFTPPRCKRNAGVWASDDYCSYVDREETKNEQNSCDC
ncbi:MAG: hypothetical protein IJ210_15175 [Clostridia bacterium]|nr:hypothetical protein [Clostridia bacterium]